MNSKKIIQNEYKIFYQLLTHNKYALKSNPNSIFIQDKSEIINFVDYVVNHNDTNDIFRFIEIGSRLGGSFVFMMKVFNKFFPNVYGLSIDLPNQPHENTGKLNLKQMVDELNCPDVKKIYYGNSHDKETHQEVKSFFGNNKINMVFIDGDHSEKGSMQDFIDYSKFLKPNGIVGFHDIVEPKHWPWVEAHKTWKKIKKQHPNNTIVEWSCNPKQYGIGAIIL